MKSAQAALLIGLALCTACEPGKRDTPPDSPPGETAMSIKVTSTGFEQGTKIPQEFTADGVDHSPPLSWSDLPPETKSLALICDDPDAPRGTWVHWVLYNLPADTQSLDAGLPAEKTLPSGALQGKNDFGKIGYNGPAPPKGKPHRYFFKLYALSETLRLDAGATKAQVVKAMQGHILAQGELMGTYQR